MPPSNGAYEDRNEVAGFYRGHVRTRLHYRDVVTAWCDQINSSPRPRLEIEPDLDRFDDAIKWHL